MNRHDRQKSANETIAYYEKLKLENKLPNTTSKLIANTFNSQTKHTYDTAIDVMSENVVSRIRAEYRDSMRVGVMNFASATNAGGGWEHGANAQEESLCRNSLLGWELQKFIKEYYNKNRKNRNQGLYTTDLIYSKNVLFMKDEISGQEVFTENSYSDVVTIAAPNRRIESDYTEKDYTKDLAIKIQHTLRAFKNNGCESIILGAFGCGVFKNDPKKVAKIFNLLLSNDEFKNVFKRVTFSIYGKNENYEAFLKEFSN